MLDDFYEFLNKNNIMPIIVATLLSDHLSNLAKSFTDDLILPIIDRDLDGDGQPDIKELKNYKIKFNGITFKVGNFCVVLLKVFIVLFLIYVVKRFFNKKTSIEK